MTDPTTHHIGPLTLLEGNCLETLSSLDNNSVDSVVTDPPYEIGFMGKDWDNSGIAYQTALWAEVLRVLKPGGHLLAFGATRSYHRMTVAIEDAGFEIRDSIHWTYGSGFPKSLDVSKAIDKAAGAERQVVGKTEKPYGYQKNGELWRKGHVITAPATDDAKQWDGWGTALKPSHEPIVMARKPLDGTVANNVLTWGTGAINIEASRIGDEIRYNQPSATKDGSPSIGGGWTATEGTVAEGRWPANSIFDTDAGEELGDAARFFYCPKPSKKEKNHGLAGMIEKRPDQRTTKGKGTFETKGVAKQANHHPTVKPIELMTYLIRLVTPPGGTVLDPFLGSGTTACAAAANGYKVIGCELTADYIDLIKKRVAYWTPEDTAEETDDNTDSEQLSLL